MERAFFSATAILAVLVSVSCSGKGGGALDVITGDETAAAAALVSEANTDLRKIKKMFTESGEAIAELEAAMKNRETAKVKAMTELFIDQIKEGSALGEEAVEKIERAERMNIDPNFREYLELKGLSLKKYIEAFRERRLAAEILQKGFDPSNSGKSDEAIAEFKKLEEKFKDLMEDARQMSEEANEIAKESINK